MCFIIFVLIWKNIITSPEDDCSSIALMFVNMTRIAQVRGEARNQDYILGVGCREGSSEALTFH